PEQQLKQFEAAGTFPSTTEAQEQLAEEATPNEFFNDAPVGSILASRAEGVVAQYKGPHDSLIQENAFGPALKSVDEGTKNGEEARNEAVSLLNELVEE